jgi:phenylalanyl-tRNA synthetase beta chain
MKTSLKWLVEFFPKAPAGRDPLSIGAELRVRLPLAGIEIGGWKRLGEGLDTVIVAQIQSFERHPNADRLNVCQVITDASKPPLQIVCGAPNVKAGAKVALAQIGTNMPGDLKIKQSAIRGVESFGMLCSERELGLSDESNGIIHLPESLPLGSPVFKALGLQDEIWEVELTPDRADCLSHWGLAREISRWVGARPELPEIEELQGTSDVAMIGCEVQAKNACPIYGAQLFEGVQNAASAPWLKRKLEALGQRSHNSVVDVTNYVLLELGHPMHAFDADKITGSKLIVRFAKNGERLVTLDDVERTLTPADLVIADLEKPLALAGVMGGRESSVSDKTTRIVLESAVFDPDVVRSASKRHKIHTDSSHRFERGVDATGAVRAAGRAAHLFRQLTGARRRGSYVEVRSDKAEKLLVSHSINLDVRSFKSVTSIEAPAEEIAKAFQSVQIDAQVKSPNVVRVDVPPHRIDLLRQIDLIEEGARVLGFDRVPERFPAQNYAPQAVTEKLYFRTRAVRRRLLETGLSECMPYCFFSEKELGFTPRLKPVEIANPLSADWRYMRTNLALGLMHVVKRHAAMGQMSGAFFDTGAAFERKAPAGEADKHPSMVTDHFHAAWALMGPRGLDHWSTDKTSWERKAHVDFFDAKGVAEELVEQLSTFEPRWGGAQYLPLDEVLADSAKRSELATQAPWIPVELLHPGRAALIAWPGKGLGQVWGYVGELHPLRKDELLNLATGLQLGVAIGEIRALPELPQARALASLVSAPDPRGKIKLSVRLPIVERDVALVFGKEARVAEIERVLKKSQGGELLELRCVDVFKLPDGKQSLAFRLKFQGTDRTLTDEEIAGFMAKAVQAAEKLGAGVR